MKYILLAKTDQYPNRYDVFGKKHEYYNTDHQVNGETFKVGQELDIFYSYPNKTNLVVVGRVVEIREDKLILEDRENAVSTNLNWTDYTTPLCDGGNQRWFRPYKETL